MAKAKSRLILGTAQFGLNYGINNNGKLSSRDLDRVFSLVNDRQICLDTSSAYGNSETIIGKRAATNIEIITKISPKKDIDVKKMFYKSLKNLKKDKIHGCFLHDFSVMKTRPDIWNQFIDLKKQGLVEKVGFSVYYPAQITYLMNNRIPFDFVQFPYNIVDQRFSYSFDVLRKHNVETHARSIFLQGLFFKDLTKKERIKFFSFLDALKIIKDIAKKEQIPISHMCMNFALLNDNIDKIVFGIDSYENLIVNLDHDKSMHATQANYKNLLNLQKNYDSMVLPTNW
tara:strand:+ start:9344 stop:10201 length:858 start_codon:yes stop_codon:yes gene_type:complete